MAITIGSNIASLQSQRRLFDTSEKLATVFERLASGQRINRAADDAAGLAISESLNTDRRVFTQAVRNLNDGQSALNIADSTVEELSSIVIRIQELATQSASGSLSNQQRESLDTEAQELREEFFRVSREAEFNGLRLFDGSLENGLRLQGGYGVDGSVFSSLGGSLANGFFEQPITSEGVDTPWGAALADFNSDGVLDFLSLDYANSDEVVVGFGDGSGTFDQSLTISIQSGAIDVQVGDLNGDGAMDFVVGGEFQDIEIFLNDGNGSFSQTLFSGATPNSQNMLLNDFDADGNLDLVVSSYDTDEFAFYLGNGDGSFSFSDLVNTQGAPTELGLGDIDGDGNAELMLSSRTSGDVVFYTFDSSGSFSNPSTLTTDTANGRASLLEDLNGDGRVDLVTSDYDSDGIQIFFGNGDGTFTEQYSAVAAVGGAFEIEAADINGDGRPDLILGGGTGMGVIEQQVNGGFSAFRSVSNGEFRSVEIGDVDGDGISDIASSQYGIANPTRVFLGSSREGINPLLEFSLETQADALQALAPLENKLNSLTAQRGVIGAFQSRLETATNTLRATTENYAAAESRIRDADIAAESANLTRLNILRQAASSVLAQANLQPSLSLALLG